MAGVGEGKDKEGARRKHCLSECHRPGRTVSAVICNSVPILSCLVYELRVV